MTTFCTVWQPYGTTFGGAYRGLLAESHPISRGRSANPVADPLPCWIGLPIRRQTRVPNPALEPIIPNPRVSESAEPPNPLGRANPQSRGVVLIFCNPLTPRPGNPQSEGSPQRDSGVIWQYQC